MALSFAMAWPTTMSEAQLLGPSLSQMQCQAQGPVYEKAQVRRGRATVRVGEGAGDEAGAPELPLVPGVIAGGVHTAADAAGDNGATD